MQVKIVDTFNGYEGPTYADEAEAEAELARRRRDFYAHQGNHNARFCQTYVPAHWTWYFSPRDNTFIWG
jgi:hypothetical protein